MIAKNEERVIKNSISSVSWADEVLVIIDSSSSDGTEKISRKLGARVFIKKWNGYSNQKNYAIGEARNDWILSIDADEIVTSKLSQEIKNLVVDKDGYFIPFRNYLGNSWLKHGGLYPDYHLRLFKKGSAKFEGLGGGQIHETVQLDNVGYLKNPIDHYTYGSIGDFWNRVLRYPTQEARERLLAGQGPIASDLVRIPWKFIKTYFIQLGILDGWYGFINALFLSFYTANIYLTQLKGKR